MLRTAGHGTVLADIDHRGPVGPIRAALRRGRRQA